MISCTVGVYERDDIVQYIVNGLPVYSHSKEDLQSFRFFTSNIIYQGLCKQTEVELCFGVSSDSVWRNLKKFKEQGEEAFFSKENRHGHCHKIRDKVQERIQNKLDKGQSVNSIAKEEKISEGSIRYSIKQGY
jgi:transposase